jgi:hypothetical protein
VNENDVAFLEARLFQAFQSRVQRRLKIRSAMAKKDNESGRKKRKRNLDRWIG